MSELNAMQRMRARLKSKEQSKNVNESVYPFWQMNFDKTTTIRFLPWYDELSRGFWTERKVLNMSFADPSDDTKKMFFKAPCLEMYEEDEYCPVASVVRDLYRRAEEEKKNGDLTECTRIEKIASFHWIKRTFYYQGFVITPGMDEDTVPLNPIREFPFSTQVHKLIYSSLMDSDDPLPLLPTGEFSMDDVNNVLNDNVSEDELEETLERFDGLNFLLKKTKKGEHANYETSKFAVGSQSSLTDDQIAAVGEYGMFDLRKKLPERPSAEQYELLKEMMEVSTQWALGEGDGVWKSEWEEAGFKPYRPKTGGSSNSDEEPTKKTSSGASAKGASLRDKLSAKSRGTAKKAVKAEVTDEVKEEEVVDSHEEMETAPVEEAVKETPNTKATDLAERIRARAAKKS